MTPRIFKRPFMASILTAGAFVSVWHQSRGWSVWAIRPWRPIWGAIRPPVSQRQKHRDDGHADTDREAGEADLPGPRAISGTSFSADHLVRLAKLAKVEDASRSEARAEPEPGLKVSGGRHRRRDGEEQA